MNLSPVTCGDMNLSPVTHIHQNPVKAGIVEKVKDYEYSSWGEYDCAVELNEQ